MGKAENNFFKNFPAKEQKLTPPIEQEIQKALEQISFGSLEIVVHDSKVVQIEIKEKIRFY